MKRILIVDDFEPGRVVLREKLERQGYICQEVSNGLQALETLQSIQFDLVITDNKMPVMSGLELIQCLSEKLPNQQPPIILLTGQPTTRVNEEAQNNGVRAIFAKPYDDQELYAAITRALAPK